MIGYNKQNTLSCSQLISFFSIWVGFLFHDGFSSANWNKEVTKTPWWRVRSVSSPPAQKRQLRANVLCADQCRGSSSLGRWMRRGLPQGEEGAGGSFPWFMFTVRCSWKERQIKAYYYIYLHISKWLSKVLTWNLQLHSTLLKTSWLI